MKRLAALPDLVKRKIYKTGQTRGADDDQIYQNRVGRNSTVLIPLASFEDCRVPDDGTESYESGYIVLVPPAWYFEAEGAEAELRRLGLRLGENALLFYDRRSDWDAFNPDALSLVAANSRTAPLGGTYVARVAGNTSQAGGHRESRGYNTTQMKGAGIRVYEYASSENLSLTRLQLEALLWACDDAVPAMVAVGMEREQAEQRRAGVLGQASELNLMDEARLRQVRILDAAAQTVCPLCLLPVSAADFMSRLVQAPGRETYALTVTEISLFHVAELRVGTLGHRPYNLGWGHHHCNVVAKDSGIEQTLDWMNAVLARNKCAGYSTAR